MVAMCELSAFNHQEKQDEEKEPSDDKESNKENTPDGPLNQDSNEGLKEEDKQGGNESVNCEGKSPHNLVTLTPEDLIVDIVKIHHGKVRPLTSKLTQTNKERARHRQNDRQKDRQNH